MTITLVVFKVNAFFKFFVGELPNTDQHDAVGRDRSAE